MTTAIAVDDITRAEPKRNRWGQYLIETPEGNTTGYVRATTIAKTIEDRHNLEKWGKRMVAAGIGQRKDLYALAASHDVNEDKSTYDGLCEKAIEAAKGGAAASTGTALHRMVEDLDLGIKQLDDLPEEFQPHCKRYVDTLAANGIKIHRQWVETILVDDGRKVAGTTDRIVTLPDGRRVIADLKTGKTVHYGWLAISIQMAIYAHHTATWDPVTETRGPKVDVDLTEALIIHLPQDGDECTLYLVDIKQGYDAYMSALEVRLLRKEAAKFAVEYKPANGGQTLREWAADRINAINDAGFISDLLNRWPDEVPKPLPAEPTVDQIDALAPVLSRVEALHELPFGPDRPGVTTQPKATAKPKGKPPTKKKAKTK